MKLEKRYLNDREIHKMGEKAKNSYFFNCCWKTAYNAAIECAADNFNVRANKAQVNTAMQIARMLWNEEYIQVRKEILEEQE